MKGEEQQADRGENGWKSRLREGGSEQQGRRRRQGAVFVGRTTLWKESRTANFGSLNCKRLDQKCYPYWLKEVSQQEMTAALIGALNS